jgi:hypothetical protein
MNPESPSIFARLRAGLAATMAGLAGGARRMEDWTARRTRPIMLMLLAGLLLIGSAIGIAAYGHAMPHGGRGDRHAAETRRVPPPKPGGKPEGKPQAPRPQAPAAPPSAGPSAP